MPSWAASECRTSWVIPAYAGAVPSSSSARSGMLRTPRSAPSAAANSAAIIQSGQAKPGAVSLGPSRLTRPSMLVVVPGRSCATAHGSTTSAWSSTD